MIFTVPSALRSSVHELNDWTDPSGCCCCDDTSTLLSPAAPRGMRPAEEAACSVHCTRICAPMSLLSSDKERSSSLPAAPDPKQLHKTYHVNETRKMKMTADNVMTQPSKRQPTKLWRIRNEKTKENRQNNSIDSLAGNSKKSHPVVGYLDVCQLLFLGSRKGGSEEPHTKLGAKENFLKR